MRRVRIFAGSSHPALGEAICERLGSSPDPCDLKKFSNGEISVNIGVSVRDQDVFIVQSGSSCINDSVIEMLVMISACKGGSAKSITAVMPYFPYSRQSKKKSHRGAITAKLLANLLSVAGIHHVITVDLHAPPTQGFFGRPVDNLRAEPIIARWIRSNVDEWKRAVVVSKNPGGTKRVTSLADALKLNFGMVTTRPRRQPLVLQSAEETISSVHSHSASHGASHTSASFSQPRSISENSKSPPRSVRPTQSSVESDVPVTQARHINHPHTSSPLTQSTRLQSNSPPPTRRRSISQRRAEDEMIVEEEANEYTDERAKEVIIGRLVHGHIVDDDAPSPIMSGTVTPWNRADGISTPRHALDPAVVDDIDPLTASFMSNLSRQHTEHADTTEVSDEEESFNDPELEHTVTLVGNVQNRTVFIIDDMIDQSGSWIAAAETVVIRGDARKVYCIATHGIFGNDSLEEMEACDCIDHIVVTNTYPIDAERVRKSSKLIILDMSSIISEAIRRNHYGESISALFQSYPD